MQPMAMAPPPTKRKGGIALGIGIGIVVLGVLGGIVGAVVGFRTVQRGIDDLQRVPLSGGTVQLDDAGNHKVYLERPATPSSGIPVVITGPGGDQIPLRSGSMSETYDLGGRHGMLLGNFSAPEPGRYRFQAPFEPSVSGQFAVGKRSPLAGFVTIGLAIFGGIGAGVVGIILIIVGAVRRSRSKRPPMGGYPAAMGGWAPPPSAPMGAGGWAPPPGGAWTPPAGPGGAHPPAPPPPAPGPTWSPPQTGGNTTWNPPPPHP